MTISDAINRGDIVVKYSSTRRSAPITDITNVITVRRRIVDHEYIITGAVDARTAEVVDCLEAVSRSILDFSDPAGEFVNSRTGARIPLRDAIESGWVSLSYLLNVQCICNVAMVVRDVDAGGIKGLNIPKLETATVTLHSQLFFKEPIFYTRKLTKQFLSTPLFSRSV